MEPAGLQDDDILATATGGGRITIHRSDMLGPLLVSYIVYIRYEYVCFDHWNEL